MTKLVYIGDGSGLPGIPARDLTDEECKSLDVKMLLASGLYELVKPNQKKDKDEVTK